MDFLIWFVVAFIALFALSIWLYIKSMQRLAKNVKTAVKAADRYIDSKIDRAKSDT